MAEAGGGELEAGGGRDDVELFDGQVTEQHGGDAEPERVARGENGDRAFVGEDFR